MLIIPLCVYHYRIFWGSPNQTERTGSSAAQGVEGETADEMEPEENLMSSYSSSQMPPYHMAAYSGGNTVRGMPNIQQQRPQSNLPEPSFVDLLAGEGDSDQFESIWQNDPLNLDLVLTQQIEPANYGPPENTLDDLAHIALDLAGRLANAIKNNQASEQKKLAQEADKRANEFAWIQTKQIEGLEYTQAKEKYKRVVNKEIGRLVNSSPPKPLNPPANSTIPISEFPDMARMSSDAFSLDFSFTDPEEATDFSGPVNSNFLLQQSLPGLDSSTPDITANLNTWHAGQRQDGPFPAKFQAAQLGSPAYNLDGFTSHMPTESITSGRSGRTDAHLRAHLQDMQLNSPASQQAQTPSDKGSVRTPKRPYSDSYPLARKPSGAADTLKPSDLTGVAKFAKDKELEEEYFLMKALRTLAVQQGLEDKLPAEFKDELDLENGSIFSRIEQQHVAEVNRLLEPPEDAVFSIKTFLKSVKKKIALALTANTNKKQRTVVDSEFNF